SVAFFAAARGRDGGKERPRVRGGKPAAAAPDPTATVSGHIEEANVGSFDLVDGVASRTSDGLVVFVTSKPIASAALAGSACPMTLARSLALMRDASWAEVTLDEDGDTSYFAYGTQYAGQSRADDPGGHYVSSALDVEDGRAEGGAKHSDYGRFTFDLPIHAPALAEPSQRDRFDNRIWSANPRVPTEAEAVAAYQTLRHAALARDLDALLAAQGFTAAQVAAVRALPGIEADLVAHAERFLTPGDLSPEDEVQLDHGFAQLAAIGKTSEGAPFFNVYELAPCGDALVLVGIGLNPQ
ncbi:MAG TPA: hypothetical protein VN811_15355, partial [Thermoanaerobaculia bacterium]|nr:hypothetical protein [Thermoanaerobaculia bacterium]